MCALQTLRLQVLITVLVLIPTTSTLAAVDCNQSIADLYEKKTSAVVLVTALIINPYRMDDRIQLATGSGFIIDAEDGLVMTNSHVVFGTQALTVKLDDGTVLPAKLLGADPLSDLAILQIPGFAHGKLPTLVFGNSGGVRPGDEVIVIGNPMGLGKTVTGGIVSGINRFLTERPQLLTWPMIQTDAAVNPGNSGGPLLNRCGNVIGVMSNMLGNTQNISFAIPSNLARSVVAQLVVKGRVIRPWFGIDGSLLYPELGKVLSLPLTEGFLVETVEPNSPASDAGIVGGHMPVKVGTQSMVMGGDVIVAINDIELKNVESMQRALNTIRIGTRVQLKVFRIGKTFTTEFAITERPLQPGDVPESSQSFSWKNDQGNSSTSR